MSSGIPADWKEFRNKHKDLIRHSKYEWDFVNDVLVNVPGLKPSQVFPQHEFVGKDGRTYHMDFAIITENVKIAGAKAGPVTCRPQQTNRALTSPNSQRVEAISNHKLPIQE
jgi:hypothetical protein